jgi:hypothetical protein
MTGAAFVLAINLAVAGLLGMAFHPGFADNGYVYLSYTTPGGTRFLSRIARFESRDGGRTLVFKLNEGETVEWIYVEPAFQTSDWAIVNHEDIAPGDTLAVDQHFALSHLQCVIPRMAGEIVREDMDEREQ